jgi:hypothetical protein
LQIRWRDIEPVQGAPDWAKLDQLFAAADSSKKWVQLLIFPGFFSPPWALEGAQSATFAIQYGPGKGTRERLPLPWDRVYLGHSIGRRANYLEIYEPDVLAPQIESVLAYGASLFK